MSSSDMLNLNTAANANGSVASITGLASGLDTTAIISEIMAVASAPMNQLQIQEDGVTAEQNQLTTIQTALQTVANDAANLSSPTLFDTSQSVSSTDPSLVAAASQTGAAVGGYELDVSQLANSAQRTFTFTSPSSDDEITIDGHQTDIPAGSTLQQFVATINADPDATVYAAATASNTVVLSSRQTGDTGTNFIQVSDPGGALAEQTSLAREGQNAQFTVDGVAGSSSSNTVTTAIPGVTLTLNGETSSPVTIAVAPPAPDAQTIGTAVSQFISDYNSAVTQIETQLTQLPVSNPQDANDAGQGTLYGDEDLTGLLTSMRQMMYTDLAGLQPGMTNLSEVGITTGAPAGDAAPSASSLSGELTVDTGTLDSAIQSNPSGVQQLFNTFSIQFQSLVNDESGPGGVISQRISDESDETTQMSSQISTMQAALAAQQSSLQTEYSNLEAALEKSQAQESSLESEIAQL